MVVTHANQSGVMSCFSLTFCENWVLIRREISAVQSDDHRPIRYLVLKCLTVPDCNVSLNKIFLLRLLLPSTFFRHSVKPRVLIRIRIFLVHSIFLNIIEYNFRSFASHTLWTTIYDLLCWKCNPCAFLLGIDPILNRSQCGKYEGSVEPFFITNDRLFGRPVVIVETKASDFSKFFIICDPLDDVIQAIELILGKISKPFNILLVIQVQLSVLDHCILILIETKIQKFPLLFLILRVIFLHIIDILDLRFRHDLLVMEGRVRDIEQ